MKQIAAISLLVAAVGGTALVSCSKSDVATPPAPSVSTQPTTQAISLQPVANAAVSGHTVKLADGLDLAQVRNQDMVHPSFSLSSPDVEAPLIFADVSNDKNDASAPVILKKIGDTWKILELTEAGDQIWAYAGVCAPRHEVWGILDSADETGGRMTLLRSVDEGATWQFFAAVKKPTPQAEYAGFSMAADGVGKLTMHLSEDADKVLHGYYEYRASDGGKTWTGPVFQGDDMTDADSQRDVDTLQEAIKDVEAVPAQ